MNPNDIYTVIVKNQNGFTNCGMTLGSVLIEKFKNQNISNGVIELDVEKLTYAVPCCSKPFSMTNVEKAWFVAASYCMIY